MKISFKNIAYFAAALFGMSFVSSCSNELEQVNEPEMKVYTFTASTTSNNVNSRTSHTESGNDIVVKWELEDIVYVGVLLDNSNVTKKVNKSTDFVQFKVTELSNDDKTATLTYKGSLPSTWQAGSKLLYYYGKGDQGTITLNKNEGSPDFGKLYIQCTYEGTIYPNPYLKQFDYLSGVAEYNGDGNIPNVDMDHIGSILRFEFSGLPALKKVDDIIVSTSDASASFFRNISLWEDGRKLSNTTTNILTSNKKPVNIDLKVDNKGNLVMYKAIPPTDLIDKKDITVTLKFDAEVDGSGILTSAGSIYTGTIKNVRAVEAGKLYTTPVIPMTKQEATE